MIGYILGLGDRHINNILIDNNTAQVIHIDFGIAFEQGKNLPTPETVPFRLTRDVVDGKCLFKNIPYESTAIVYCHASCDTCYNYKVGTPFLKLP